MADAVTDAGGRAAPHEVTPRGVEAQKVALSDVALPAVAVRAVTVRYFAAAADAAGCEQELLQVVPTAAALRALLIERYGAAMAHVLDVGSLLVDGVAARDPHHPIDTAVDVLPPFAGG